MLLHCAGIKVQSIYDKLDDVVDNVARGPLLEAMIPQLTEYDHMLMKLEHFFSPKRNPTFERHVFRQMEQKENEKVDHFVIRLKKQAEKCDYGNRFEEFVKDQLTAGCHSNILRRKILENGEKNLEHILKLSRIFEAVQEGQKVFELNRSATKLSDLEINKIASKKAPFNQNQSFRFPNKNRTTFKPNGNRNPCNRCGFADHFGNFGNCPAKGKRCAKCGGLNHFKAKCYTKITENNRRFKSYDQNKHSNEKDPRPTEVSNIVTKPDSPAIKYDECYDDDIFCITAVGDNNEICCNIGGVKIKAIIDSGSKCNIIDKNTWKVLKSMNVKVKNKTSGSDRTFKSYGGHAIHVIGMFESKIKINDKETDAKFYVTSDEGKCLIGSDTAKNLNVLKVGEEINHVMASKNEFPKIKGVLVDIPIKKEIKPVAQPYRRVPVPLEKAVDAKIKELCSQGIIEKVNGPSKWISPLVIVPKHNSQDIRVCLDMRRANDAVERENHPLPTVEDFLPHLGKAKYFSKLDVKNAFHQVEISPDSREITTFITKKGLFRYTRLMFGITCAPELFQKIMEQILSGCAGCFNYIDDIIIFGFSKKEHDCRLEKVMARLKDFNVTLNEEKCLFGQTKIIFLGHELSPAGIRPMYDKVEAIKQFRNPQGIEETRSFLGLVNYIGKFIPNLASMTEPIRKLTRNNASFYWGGEQQKAFQQIKTAISQELILGYYDVKDRTQIIADAGPVGLGAVLIQYDERGPRIIAFASKSLTDVERRYAQTDKEALALVWAVERFHFYVFGREFELITDHKPLETLFGIRSKPCARIERWLMRLQSYKYKTIYRPGKTNIADSLSRLSFPAATSVSKVGPQAEEYVKWILAISEPKAIKIAEIIQASTSDVEIQAVKQGLFENDWTLHAQNYKLFEPELCLVDNILLRGTRIIIPTNLRERTLQLAHEGHPGMSVMKKRLRAKVWWPKIDQDVEKHVKKCFGCTLVSAPNAPEPMRRTKLPSEPWQHIAIDYCGMLPSGDHMLVIVDYFSRFIEVEIMQKIDSFSTIQRLKPIFARFGFPVSITADNGGQFLSSEFNTYCDNNNIQLISTTPYWPQQNGEVERQNRTLLKRLIISQNTGRNWKEDLNEFLLMYRSTPHSVTLKSPAEMMFNHPIRDKIPTLNQPLEVDEEVRDRDALQKEKGRIYGDRKRNANTIEINEGDLVLSKRQVIKNKLDSTFGTTIFKVIKRSGSEALIESTETSVRYRRNVAHLKKIQVDHREQNQALTTERHSQQNYNSSSGNNDSSDNEPSAYDHGNNQEANTNEIDPPPHKRIRRAPSKLKDYDVSVD